MAVASQTFLFIYLSELKNSTNVNNKNIVKRIKQIRDLEVL
jgi:hypothetical protein